MVIVFSNFLNFFMYAIANIKGLQYQVSEGDTVQVATKKNVQAGESITLSDILLISDNGEVKIGTPYIEGAKIEAKVIGTTFGEKVRTVKHKRRKRYIRTKGHKQAYTSLEISKIIL